MEPQHTKIERQRHELTASTAMMRVAGDSARHPEEAARLADARGRIYAGLPIIADRFAISPSSVHPKVIVRDTAGEIEAATVPLIDADPFVRAVNFVTGLAWNDSEAGTALRVTEQTGAARAWQCQMTGAVLSSDVDDIAGTQLALDWLGVAVSFS